MPLDKIREAVWYEYGIYSRNENYLTYINPHNNDKGNEFIYIIKNLIDCKCDIGNKICKCFDKINWELDSETHDANNCICTKDIRNPKVITFLPNNISIAVGSVCVEKVSDDLYNKLFKPRCIECNENPYDGRKICGKHKICDENCMRNRIRSKFNNYISSNNCLNCRKDLYCREFGFKKNPRRNYGACSESCLEKMVNKVNIIIPETESDTESDTEPEPEPEPVTIPVTIHKCMMCLDNNSQIDRGKFKVCSFCYDTHCRLYFGKYNKCSIFYIYNVDRQYLIWILKQIKKGKTFYRLTEGGINIIEKLPRLIKKYKI